MHHFALRLLLLTACAFPMAGLSAEEAGPIKKLIAKVRPSVATIRVQGRDGDALGMGTGFVIDPDGLIVTNFHVIKEGRPFTVEMSSGRKLNVLAVEASDRLSDLAVIRVDVGAEPLPALELADGSNVDQGTRVLAFGNPLGLRDSVVDGIVSAIRDVQGRSMIQLAMPIEPGNSGGPLVDVQGRVIGIINMKSAVDLNLGFAIPIGQLAPLRSKPNPIAIDRWVLLGGINEEDWTPVFGAKWMQRGGMISARGMGVGFGGRSLCLSTQAAPEVPYEIAVSVRLDDESGAAGLAFCSDGDDLHYGFYPSGGRLRLTCFRGPTVYAWQVLNESESPHYVAGQWNRLRIRVEENRFQCFVNDQLVVESADQQLKRGKIGLVKFRNTNPDFKRFEVGPELGAEAMEESTLQWLSDLRERPELVDSIATSEMERFGEDGEAASQSLIRRARELETQAKKVRRLAADVRLVPTLKELRKLFGERDDAYHSRDLLRGALLIAMLDDSDVDVDAYVRQVDQMADEIRGRIKEGADDGTKLETLDRYLFQENGFHGGRAEYYHPANSHMNRVIDDREGLPITMSILYMELGRRIGLQIEGIGIPGHFVVRHVASEEKAEAQTEQETDNTEQEAGDTEQEAGDTEQEAGDTEQEADDSEQETGDSEQEAKHAGQLIDVFDGGTRLSLAEAQLRVVGNTGRGLVESDLHAQTTRQILTRVLRNLMGIASDNRDAESLRRYAEGLVALHPDSVDFRMMRAELRGMTDRATAALEDLDWLIERDPPGLDLTAAKQMRDALLSQE